MNLTGCEIRFVLLGQMAERQSGALQLQVGRAHK